MHQPKLTTKTMLNYYSSKYITGLVRYVLILFFLYNAKAQSTTDLNLTLDRVEQYIEQRDLTSADALLKEIIRKNPDSETYETTRFWYINGMLADQAYRTYDQDVMERPAEKAIAYYNKTISSDEVHSYYTKMAQQRLDELDQHINDRIRTFMQNRESGSELKDFQSRMDIQRKAEYMHEHTVTARNIDERKQSMQYLKNVSTRGKEDVDKDIYWTMAKTMRETDDSLSNRLRYAEQLRLLSPNDTSLLLHEARLLETDSATHYDVLIPIYTKMTRMNPGNKDFSYHLASAYYAQATSYQLNDKDFLAEMYYLRAQSVLEDMKKDEEEPEEGSAEEVLLKDIKQRLSALENDE